MNRRRGERLSLSASLAGVAVVVAVLLGLGALPAQTRADSGPGKIAVRVLRATSDGGSASFLVYLRHQADLSAAYGIRDTDARGWYVYRTLKKYASRTQAPIERLLARRGISYTSLWAANAIVVEGGRALVDALAARTDVGAIESNAGSRWIPAGDRTKIRRATSPSVVELGVSSVNAPQMWALGFTGTGIVIAEQDTGVLWTHVALKSHYRGWNGSAANHNFNWWDAIHTSVGNPCGNDAAAPCDDNGHGTHTTGTEVGDDGGVNQIGVAPGAKWMACRNMDQGTGTPQTYAECFQFLIAPTNLNGQNADPAKRPHVANNSWTCPASEGCAANTLQTVVENAEASGIFVLAAAGNSGPGCSTVDVPPAIYNASFSVGAINSSTNELANFSSRGPVTADGSGRVKPDIVAPGVNVRSAYSLSDTTYANLSGTSMAAPHVTGVVALLWSARPALRRDIARTKQVLTSTANPGVTVPVNGAACGGTAALPNNHFGWGRVDALAAYQASADGAGTMTTPTSEVSASASGKTITFTYTAAQSGMTNGAITIDVPSGWSAPSTGPSARGYTTASAGTVSVSGQTITVSNLTRNTGQTVTITYGSKGGGGPGATVSGTTGNRRWQAKQKTNAAGTLTKLASSPSIAVYARDGSGTLTTPTTSVAHGSTGNTIVFTYTAAAGGMKDGTLTVVVPSSWSGPATSATARGYTTSNSGVVSVSSRTILVSSLTRSAGQTVKVTYGSKAGGGPGANAPPTSTGAQTWSAKQRSIVVGALTSLSSSPVITVN